MDSSYEDSIHFEEYFTLRNNEKESEYSLWEIKTYLFVGLEVQNHVSSQGCDSLESSGR